MTWVPPKLAICSISRRIAPHSGVAQSEAVRTPTRRRAWGFAAKALPTFVPVDKAWAHRVEGVHEWLGNAMMVLIGVHVAATLFHSIALRDNTLARMFGRRAHGFTKP